MSNKFLNLDNISAVSVKHTIATDLAAYGEFMDGLYEKKFSVAQIGISRQELVNWKKNGLIIGDVDQGRSWIKVSFFEYCWIRLISELRKLNLPLSVIQKLKENLFATHEDEIYELMKQNQVEGIDAFTIDGIGKDEFSTFLHSMPDYVKQSIVQYFNTFNTYMLYLIFDNITSNILVDLNGEYLFLIPDRLDDKDHLLELESFSKKSFVSVPLDTILGEFYSNKKIKSQDVKQLFKLSEREIKIFEILRRENIKEVRIRKNDKNKGSLVVEVVEEKNINIIQDKIEAILKRDKIQDIRVYHEKGKVLYFEETTRIKI